VEPPVAGKTSYDKMSLYLLESAGGQGLSVSGLRGSHGEGDGDRSLLARVICIGGSTRTSEGRLAANRVVPFGTMPSPEIPFSDKNSSRSTYCSAA